MVIKKWSESECEFSHELIHVPHDDTRSHGQAVFRFFEITKVKEFCVLVELVDQ